MIPGCQESFGPLIPGNSKRGFPQEVHYLHLQSSFFASHSRLLLGALRRTPRNNNGQVWHLPRQTCPNKKSTLGCSLPSSTQNWSRACSANVQIWDIESDSKLHKHKKCSDKITGNGRSALQTRKPNIWIWVFAGVCFEMFEENQYNSKKAHTQIYIYITLKGRQTYTYTNWILPKEV